MRIGVNCYLLQPHIGGLKQYFLTLFQELLEHDTDNEYIFFWYAHNADELAKLGTERWKKQAVFLRDQLEVLNHLTHLDLYFCPFSVLYPRPLPLPTVMTLVDIQEMFYPEFFTVDERYNRDLHFPGSTYMADRVITISDFSKQTLIQHHHLPPGKIVVAPLSADGRYARSEQIARPPEYPLPSDFIFYPANFWKHKNHDRLLQALRILRDQRSQTVEVVFTGFDEPDGYPLAKKIAEYGLQPHAHLLGYLTVEEIAYLYRHARMLVFPSLFEGFGIPVVEAMAAGCPVVASNTTSIPEVVADAAELFDPTSAQSMAETIEKVWCDPALRRKLAALGKQRAPSFSPARTAQAHLVAFAEARQAYARPRYMWQRWVYRRYDRARVEFNWREYRLRHLKYKLTRRFGLDRASDSHPVVLSGWHALERSGVDWWCWTSRRGKIRVFVPQAAESVLSGELYAIQQPNTVEIYVNGRKSAALKLMANEFAPFELVTVGLRAGENILEFFSRNPPVTQSHDKRPLALAVKNLRLTLNSGQVYELQA